MSTNYTFFTIIKVAASSSNYFLSRSNGFDLCFETCFFFSQMNFVNREYNGPVITQKEIPLWRKLWMEKKCQKIVEKLMKNCRKIDEKLSKN